MSSPRLAPGMNLEVLRQRAQGVHLPGHFGIEFTHLEPGLVRARLPVRPELMASNGYLHAATVIALADTSCGFGTVAHLPEGASGFTTVELKSNFLGTVRDGAIRSEARPVHAGRTTQVWDAEVFDEASGRRIALFRCTEMILYPQG